MKLNVNYVLLLTCSGIFGALPNNWNIPEAKLIGGHSTTPSNHPYLVSLQTRLFIVRAHTCGGTLLNENWILTAAHCIQGSFLIRWFPMDAVAGASNAHEAQASRFGPGTQIVTVDQRVPHPGYQNGLGPNDIAVLHTSSPFVFTKYVKPARLPVPLRTSYEHPLMLAGWGILRTTFFFPDLPKQLQEVKVTYLPYNDCYKAVDAVKDAGEVNPLDEASHICTGPITGGVSACSGDSGGPLVQFVPKEEEFTNDNNDIEDHYPLTLPQGKDGKTNEKENEVTPVVVGVVSWGISPCGEKGAPTVYTKVEQFIDFINKYIQPYPMFSFRVPKCKIK